MRVLVVTPWFPSDEHPVSGLFNLRDANLLAQDHEVLVLHLIRPDWFAPEQASETVDGIPVTRVPYSVSAPSTWSRAASVIRSELRDSDLLHTMAFPALLPFALRRVTVPWIHTEHFSALVTPPYSKLTGLGLGALKQLFRRPDETVAVSSSLARVLDGHRKRPTTVIANEVMRPISAVPRTHDLTAPLRLIGVGGLVPRKGPLETVDMLAALTARGLDVQLEWVGDGELHEAVLAHAKAIGVHDRVRLTGILTPEELSARLLESDVFVLPVETETFGVAVAEALTHGLPVIATGTGGHEEFLSPEVSRLISNRNGNALADGLQQLIADSALLERADIADHAATRFSDETRLERYREVYRQARR